MNEWYKREALRSVVKEGFSPISERLNNIEQKIDGIANQVAANSENITDIKDNQKVIANVINQISDVQERFSGTHYQLISKKISRPRRWT